MNCPELQLQIKRARLRDIRDERFPGLKSHLIECRDCERVFLEKVNAVVFRGLLNQCHKHRKTEKETPGEASPAASPHDRGPHDRGPHLGSTEIVCSVDFPDGAVAVVHTEQPVDGDFVDDHVALADVLHGAVGPGTRADLQSLDPSWLVVDGHLDDFCKMHGVDGPVRNQIIRAWWAGVTSNRAVNADRALPVHQATSLSSVVASGSSLGENEDISPANHASGGLHCDANQAGLTSGSSHICGPDIREGVRQAVLRADKLQTAGHGARAEPTYEEIECVRQALTSQPWLDAHRDGDAAAIDAAASAIFRDVHAKIEGPYRVRSASELEQLVRRWGTPLLLCVRSLPNTSEPTAA